MSGPAPDDMQQMLVSVLPNLRAFARSLCRNPHQADDLVQETLVKAWKNRETFVPGSNLKAWLFTILRNVYLSEHRKRKNEVRDTDGIMADQLSVPGEQPGHMDMVDFLSALEQLPHDQQEALILVGAEGFSYEEVAKMCACAEGTVKSRVNRARARLCEILSVEGASDFGSDQAIRVRLRAAS